MAGQVYSGLKLKSTDQFPVVYLYLEKIDFRKSINGLSALVQEQMKLDPFDDALFVFCCQRKRKLKILYWDQTGFALWYKRLAEDKFPWPRLVEGQVLTVTSKELNWLLEGINFLALQPHSSKNYSLSC